MYTWILHSTSPVFTASYCVGSMFTPWRKTTWKQAGCRMTSAVMIPTWNTACSEPADCTLATQLLWCMKCNTKYNLIFWLAARQSGSLQTQPVQCLSVFECVCCCCASRLLCPSVSRRAHDIGDECFGIESQGESSPPPPRDHPRRRRVVCHPVPIDSTRGCNSAVLFIGPSHPRLLPRPICVTLARRWRI